MKSKSKEQVARVVPYCLQSLNVQLVKSLLTLFGANMGKIEDVTLITDG